VSKVFKARPEPLAHKVFKVRQAQPAHKVFKVTRGFKVSKVFKARQAQLGQLAQALDSKQYSY
jgi:hypothetical protein